MRKRKDRNYGKYQIDFMISFGLGRSKGLIDNIWDINLCSFGSKEVFCIWFSTWTKRLFWASRMSQRVISELFKSIVKADFLEESSIYKLISLSIRLLVPSFCKLIDSPAISSSASIPSAHISTYQPWS